MLITKYTKDMISGNDKTAKIPLFGDSLTTISDKARVHTYGRIGGFTQVPTMNDIRSRQRNLFSRLYDGQYERRAKLTANRIAAFHLVWTVLINMKSEIDEELEKRCAYVGEVKKWSKRTEEEFDHYLGIIERQIIKKDLPLLTEDYEELDTLLRKCCNLETKVKYSFGRLLHTMSYLLGFASVMKEQFLDKIDTQDTYCRRLIESVTILEKSAIKYINEASMTITLVEIPMSCKDFMEIMRGFMVKKQ